MNAITNSMATPTGAFVCSDAENLRGAMREWSALASRPWGDGPRREDDDVAWEQALYAMQQARSPQTLLAAAQQMLRLAAQFEHNPPNAGCNILNGIFAVEGGTEARPAGVRLTWDGTFTEGRWVCIDIHFDGDKIDQVAINWDTGTGEPSRFLSNLAELTSQPGWESAE